MKKVIYILLFTTILIGGTVGLWFYNSVMYLARYHSPNGNYELVIKRSQRIFSPTMPGNGGLENISVEVVLKDINGRIIATSNSNKNCAVLFGSIHVRWDIEKGEVWYARAKIINLKTGRVLC